MPRGPEGEHRPADVIGAAVKVMRIAAGKEADAPAPLDNAAAEMGRKGGAARAQSLTAEQRAEIA